MNETKVMALVTLELISFVFWFIIYIPFLLGEYSFFSVVLAPFSLVFPLILIYMVNFQRLVNAHIDFLEKIQGLSPLHVFFYLINAIILTYLIILPLIAPALLLFLIIDLPYRISQRFKRIGMLLFVITLLILLPFAYYVFIIIYAKLFSGILFSVFQTFLVLCPIVYNISICFAAAISIGSFTKLIYEGARVIDPTVVIPTMKIYVIEIVLGACFLLLMIIFPWSLSIISYLLVLYLIEFLIRKVKKLELKVGKRSVFLFSVILIFEFLRKVPILWSHFSHLIPHLVPETLMENLVAFFTKFESIFILITTIFFLFTFITCLMSVEK